MRLFTVVYIYKHKKGLEAASLRNKRMVTRINRNKNTHTITFTLKRFKPICDMSDAREEERNKKTESNVHSKHSFHFNKKHSQFTYITLISMNNFNSNKKKKKKIDKF